MERWRGDRARDRPTGQENFPDDFSLRLVPIFFVMWRAKNEQRRKGIGRGELESRVWMDLVCVRWLWPSRAGPTHWTIVMIVGLCWVSNTFI